VLGSDLLKVCVMICRLMQKRCQRRNVHGQSPLLSISLPRHPFSLPCGPSKGLRNPVTSDCRSRWLVAPGEITGCTDARWWNWDGAIETFKIHICALAFASPTLREKAEAPKRMPFGGEYRHWPDREGRNRA
jgi:hypothetical protein